MTEHAVESFLLKWAKALNRESMLTSTVDTYYHELKDALQGRPAIKRMTGNPIMLTALAVVHWNERKLPEGRANLYHSIITWLLLSRKNRPGRFTSETCKSHLQHLALAMQMHPDGRQVNVGRRWAAEQLYPGFSGRSNEEKIKKAERFLAEEEVDSGIIVSRGNNITFWHLTFQEYLAALALGGKMESEQQSLLITREILHDPSWREVLLLFGGVLYNQGKDKINGFLTAILGTADAQKKILANEAQCAGLIGAIIRDIPSDTYEYKNDRYTGMLTRVMGIFDKKTAPGIPLKIRVEAADALAQAGDLRFAKPEKNWIAIPGCTFLMGAQKQDPGKPNYDPDASDRESPVHKVTLSLYKIAKYPVTAGEYKKFIDDGGYTKEEYWIPEGWGFLKKENITAPGLWEDQVLYGTRPVTGVTWFEAMAYAKWVGADLPSEAEWERATRGGIKYKKYPWGKDEPDGKITHSGHNNLGHAAPVGIFPADCTTEGAVDKGGNVWEWCKDWYGDTEFYTKSHESTDPVNDESGNLGIVGKKEHRTVRGGCWLNRSRYYFRCAYRGRFVPLGRYNDLGFRLVLRSQVHR